MSFSLVYSRQLWNIPYYQGTMDQHLYSLVNPDVCSTSLTDISVPIPFKWGVQDYQNLSTLYRGEATAKWKSNMGPPSMVTYIHIVPMAIVTSLGNIIVCDMEIIYLGCFNHDQLYSVQRTHFYFLRVSRYLHITSYSHLIKDVYQM